MLDHCLDMLCHLAAKTGQGRELLADMIALRREQEEHEKTIHDRRIDSSNFRTGDGWKANNRQR